jgi:hypothetical protein
MVLPVKSAFTLSPPVEALSWIEFPIPDIVLMMKKSAGLKVDSTMWGVRQKTNEGKVTTRIQTFSARALSADEVLGEIVRQFEILRESVNNPAIDLVVGLVSLISGAEFLLTPLTVCTLQESGRAGAVPS